MLYIHLALFPMGGRERALVVGGLRAGWVVVVSVCLKCACIVEGVW